MTIDYNNWKAIENREANNRHDFASCQMFESDPLGSRMERCSSLELDIENE